MDFTYFPEAPSPCFVLEESLLRNNLQLIQRVQREAGIEIILALKGFAMWSVFPIVKEYVNTSTASSLYEARLCFEEMHAKAHTYAAAFHPEEIDDILKYSSHITFNSVAQFELYKQKAANAGVSCGLRVNPEYSEVQTEMYNPCASGSRLGLSVENLGDSLPEGVEGLHFHALCENDSYTLEHVLENFERLYGKYLTQCQWVNFGGGHLMTRKDYQVEHLISLLKSFKARYPHLKIIMEPGSAFAWETGHLIGTVLDIVNNKGVKTLMMDISFTAHMPDTLEMPYRPRIRGATDPVAGQATYRIGGVSCLSGDYMTEYSFEQEVRVGDRLLFEDMIHYTMVKTTMFNGVRHPAIAVLDSSGQLHIKKVFHYEDYKSRLS